MAESACGEICAPPPYSGYLFWGKAAGRSRRAGAGTAVTVPRGGRSQRRSQTACEASESPFATALEGEGGPPDARRRPRRNLRRRRSRNSRKSGRSRPVIVQNRAPMHGIAATAGPLSGAAAYPGRVKTGRAAGEIGTIKRRTARVPLLRRALLPALFFFKI